MKEIDLSQLPKPQPFEVTRNTKFLGQGWTEHDRIFDKVKAEFVQRNPLFVKERYTLIKQNPSLAHLAHYTVKDFTCYSNEIAFIPYTGQPDRAYFKALDAFISRSDLTPDCDSKDSQWQVNFYQGGGVNDFIAFKLGKDALTEGADDRVATIRELYSVMDKYSLSTQDLEQNLHLSLDRMTSQDIITTLVDKRLIKPNELPDYFRNMAIWNTLLSVHRSFRDWKVNVFLPASQSPHHLGYLPYMYKSLVEYMKLIPEVLPEGQIYPVDDLPARIRELGTYTRDLVQRSASDYDPSDVNEVIAHLNVQISDIKATLEDFRRNPGKWNKGKRRELKGDIVTTASIRERIRDFGGRAPRHLDIKRKHEARREI